MRETEYVSAGELREGDELPRYGTVTRILNDSTVLSVDTTDPPYGFMKSQHAPVERYKAEPPVKTKIPRSQYCDKAERKERTKEQ
jgi:hypothetical protein